MKTMISKVKANINYDFINKDFKLIKIIDKQEPKYPPKNIFLDDLNEKTGCRIFSTVAKNLLEPALFLLIKKDTYDYEKLNNYIENRYKILEIENIEDEELIPILTQLFINTYIDYNSKKYTNITGRLIIPVINKKIKVCIEISIDKNMFLHLDVITMKLMTKTNRNSSKGPRTQYRIKGKAFEKIKNEIKNDGTIFIQKGSSEKHNSISFLGLDKKNDNYKFYSNSKIGVLTKVLYSINNEFKDYINITFEEKEFINVSNNKKISNWTKEDNKDFVINEINNGINIINKSEDNKYLNDLVFMIREMGINNVFQNKIIQPNMYNIIIEHNKEFYKDELDIHYVYKNAVVHHITVETLEEKNKKDIQTSILVIFKELIIKKDLLINKKMTLINFEKFNLDDNIIFAKKNKNNNLNQVCFLRISPKGEMEYFSEYDTEDYEDIIKIFDDCQNDESIIVKYKDNIEMITDNKTFPLPSLENCKIFFDKYNLEYELSGKEWIKCITNKKLLENEKMKTIIENNINNLNIFKFEDIFKELSISNKKIALEDVFYSKNIICSLYNRDNKFVSNCYQSLIGINYFKENENIYYWVGCLTSENFHDIRNACMIREVKTLIGNSFFVDILAPMLDVQFVKWTSQTVYPFPFKYLNEAITFISN